MEKRVVAKYLAVYLIFVLMIVGLVFLRYGSLTGFAVFSQGNQTGFNEGTYSNTEYNGSAVVLAGKNLTGTYTSKIFDAGNDANWNFLSYSGTTPSLESLFCVDGGGDIYKSINSGVTWVLSQEDFGRTTATTNMFSNPNYLYILSSNGNEVWRSADGTGFVVVYNDFEGKSPYEGKSDNNGNLYVVTGVGEVWRSSDNGLTWTKQGDFNEASTNDPKGIAIDSNNYIYVVGGAGNVFKSTDSGVTWVKMVDGYGGGTETDDLEVDSSDYLYILLNKKIYKSIDSGVTWNIINNSFTSYTNNGMRMLIDSDDNFYIADGVGRIFKSTNSGVSWSEIGDCNNAAGNDPKGLTDFSQNTNLTIQVRNCSLADCSDASFTDVSLASLNLEGRYFQYKVSFATPDSSVSPELNDVTIDYDLINTAPTISLVKPGEGETYGYNVSLSLKFSVSDADDNIDKCWYNIDSSSDIIIPNCQNTTFDTSEGSHLLAIYVNDTQGETASDSATFTVSVGAPSISLNSPVNIYLNYKDITFRYTPADTDLESCELWGFSTLSFSKNQTDDFPISGSENTFSLVLDDGTYMWNVKCNDSLGNEAFEGNKTFIIDTINPSLTLNQPSGTKTSRTVTASWNVSDLNLNSCKYSVYRGGSIEVTNTSVACLATSTSFSVTVDADFTFSFYVNDSAGNSNSSSSDFKVSTSSTTTIVTESGGGTTTTTPALPVAEGKLELSEIGNVVVKPGESKTLSLSVKNIGSVFLNKCKLIGRGYAGEIISSKGVKGLAIGQQEEFIFVLNVPEDFSEDRTLDISVICDEAEGSMSFDILLSKNIIEIELISSEQKGNNFNFVYFVREKTDRNQEINAKFWLENVDDVKVVEGEDSFSLGKGEELRKEATLNLPKDAGEYTLAIELESDGSLISLREPVIIGRAAGLIGRAILVAGGGKVLIIAAFVALLAFVVIYVVRRIIRKSVQEERAGYVKVKLGKEKTD